MAFPRHPKYLPAAFDYSNQLQKRLSKNNIEPPICVQKEGSRMIYRVDFTEKRVSSDLDKFITWLKENQIKYQISKNEDTSVRNISISKTEYDEVIWAVEASILQVFQMNSANLGPFNSLPRYRLEFEKSEERQKLIDAFDIKDSSCSIGLGLSNTLTIPSGEFTRLTAMLVVPLHLTVLNPGEQPQQKARLGYF